MRTYSEIFELAGSIHPPPEDEHLSVEWILDKRLAVGRDSRGRYVVVLSGDPIVAESPSVSRVLAPSRWRHESGEPVNGTVICLHAGPPFHIAATAITVEFLRRNIASRPTTDVFPEVEPFIELVIRRVLLPPEFILGLLGELIVFDYLLASLASLDSQQRTSACSLWRGFTRQSRDFIFNRMAVEVKTTTGPHRRHFIGGLDQVEPRIIDGGMREALYLVSLGLQPEPSGNSRFSVHQLVSRIQHRLDEAEAQEFGSQVRSYGPSDCVGYDHESMSTWEPYTRRYRVSIEPRIYDLSDHNLRLIRTRDLQERIVLPEGLTYQIELPETVPGSHGRNPRVGLRREFERMLREYAETS